MRNFYVGDGKQFTSDMVLFTGKKKFQQKGSHKSKLNFNIYRSSLTCGEYVKKWEFIEI